MFVVGTLDQWSRVLLNHVISTIAVPLQLCYKPLPLEHFTFYTLAIYALGVTDSDMSKSTDDAQYGQQVL
jgi:hypothetical protein